MNLGIAFLAICLTFCISHTNTQNVWSGPDTGCCGRCCGFGCCGGPPDKGPPSQGEGPPAKEHSGPWSCRQCNITEKSCDKPEKATVCDDIGTTILAGACKKLGTSAESDDVFKWVCAQNCEYGIGEPFVRCCDNKSGCDPDDPEVEEDSDAGVGPGSTATSLQTSIFGLSFSAVYFVYV